MNRTFVLLASIFSCGVLLLTNAYASTSDFASELHKELNALDRETMTDQFASMVMQIRPEYRTKEHELKRIILRILDSKEYEAIRVGYFTKAFTNQELREQIDLVRSQAFKLHQRRMADHAKFSGVALMELVQKALSQSADSLKSPVASLPKNEKHSPSKINSELNDRTTNERTSLVEVKDTQTPKPSVSDNWHATLITATGTSTPGNIQGVTDSFSFDGKIHAHLTLVAKELPMVVPINARFTFKWFNEGTLVYERSSTYSIARSPYFFVNAVPGTALGSGKLKVEVYSDNELLSTREFAISAR